MIEAQSIDIIIMIIIIIIIIKFKMILSFITSLAQDTFFHWPLLIFLSTIHPILV